MQTIFESSKWSLNVPALTWHLICGLGALAMTMVILFKMTDLHLVFLLSIVSWKVCFYLFSGSENQFDLPQVISYLENTMTSK